MNFSQLGILNGTDAQKIQQLSSQIRTLQIELEEYLRDLERRIRLLESNNSQE